MVTTFNSIAAVACHYLELNLYAIAAYALLTTPSEISKFKQLWQW
ncbi:hypothetical protein [Nostoc sp.]